MKLIVSLKQKEKLLQERGVKNLLYPIAFALSAFLFFYSCSIDEDDAPPPAAIVKKYTLSVTAGEGGTISDIVGKYFSEITRTYSEGTQVIIAAFPNSGHSFTGWSNGSTQNPITVTLNSNTNLSATFTSIINRYTLTVTAGEGGTVSTQGGTYDEGTEVTITALPAEGYEFVGWEGSDSTEASLTVTLGANTTLIALFEFIPPEVQNGKYALSYFSEDTYNTLNVINFENNLLNYNPITIFEFKDSLVIDALRYLRVSDFWYIDTNERATEPFSVREFAYKDLPFKENTTDSLPYITYLEAVNNKVIKFKLRNPNEDKTEYGYGRLLEQEPPTMNDFYSNVGFFRDPIYSQLDPFDFKSMLRGFIADAERHGVDLSNVDVENSILALSDNPIAPAWVTWETWCNPNLAKINYAKALWLNRGLYDKHAQKLQILWHEFGHDLLFMDHWAAGGQIMSSSGGRGTSNSCNYGMYDLTMIPPDDCRDWERAVNDLFAHFKEAQESGIKGEYQYEFDCN